MKTMWQGIFTRCSAISFCPEMCIRDSTMPPVIPARTDSMNDIFAGQLIALRDFCAPGFAAVERVTFRQQRRSCSTMNAAVHTAATQQRLVRTAAEQGRNGGGNIHRDSGNTLRTLKALSLIHIFS